MNESKFNGKGTVYSISRPMYPKALIDHLAARGIFTKESSVADIGSGTGIFSLQIQPFVKSVFAVEPNASMRSRTEALFRNYSNVISVNSSAENTKLEPHSIDCISAAQAFHWFDRPLFKAECKRILKPGGHVILLWNDRDENSEIIKRNAEINSLFCPDYKGFSNGMDFDNIQQFDDFFEGVYEVKLFRNIVTCDLETFIARNLSSSYAPKRGEENYGPYISALVRLFSDFSSDQKLEYPYLTRCYVGTV